MAIGKLCSFITLNKIFTFCRFLRWVCPKASASQPSALPFCQFKRVCDSGLPYFSAEAVLLIYAKNVSPAIIRFVPYNLFTFT